MTRRRALMARVESGGQLPEAYQAVEYLESTGTQSINLGVYANQDSVMISDVLFVKSNQSFYYGGGTAYGSKTFECYFWNPNLQFNEWGSTIYLSGSDVPNNIRATIYHSLNRYALTYAGGDVSREETFTSTFQTEYPVHLFALNRQSGVAYGKARIYGAEFYQGQTIVRKCIPCYRKSDDKPGMYDLVSETFLTNAGTGEFLVGPDVIDSISPWMVARRRMLIGDQNKLILYANGNEHTAITGG